MQNFDVGVEPLNNESEPGYPLRIQQGRVKRNPMLVVGLLSLAVAILVIFLVSFSMTITALQNKVDDLTKAQHESTQNQRSIMSTNAKLQSQLNGLDHSRNNNISVEIPANVSGCGASDSWIAYKHEKCFKILDRPLTHSEAEEECLKEFPTEDFPDQNSKMIPLLTIDSSQEQQFLNRFIFLDSKILDNVWLGAQRQTHGRKSTFHWKFGTGNGTGLTSEEDNHFHNWQESYPSSTLDNRCAQMVPHGTRVSSGWSQDVDGLWQDAPCLRRNVVVCQKPQVFSLANLNSKFVEFKKEAMGKFKSLEKTEGSVPLGFIYIQYRNQSAPSDLWPLLTWKDVTYSYRGEFFRAYGNGSSSFGKIQHENAPRLTKIQYKENEPGELVVSLPVGGESENVGTASQYGPGEYHDSLTFFTSGGEVRPKNSAIKIWKRI